MKYESICVRVKSCTRMLYMIYTFMDESDHNNIEARIHINSHTHTLVVCEREKILDNTRALKPKFRTFFILIAD
jgi:hypothetical protein